MMDILWFVACTCDFLPSGFQDLCSHTNVQLRPAFICFRAGPTRCSPQEQHAGWQKKHADGTSQNRQSMHPAKRIFLLDMFLFVVNVRGEDCKLVSCTDSKKVKNVHIPQKCQRGCWDRMKVQKLNRGRAAALFIDYLEWILFKQITLYFATSALNILTDIFKKCLATQVQF